jgi:long-subunit fatty acid transport protein
MVKTGNSYEDFESFLPKVPAQLQQNVAVAQSHLTLINKYEELGQPMTAELKAAQAELKQGLAQMAASKDEMAKLAKYSEGVNLLCNQSSVGVAPIVGIDYKLNEHFNFAAKYEFKTQIRMKNESTLNEASELDIVNKYRDGEKVNEDIPALLTVGVQYSPINVVRINAGYHHYFDKDATWYNNSQELLSHNTNEFLLGAEWDTTEKLTFSAGGQLTRYGMTDEYINDISFVVNSYSIGFGFNYKLSKVVTVKAAYFQTYYSNYDRTNAENPEIKDSFTRTNRVFGVGCELSL